MSHRQERIMSLALLAAIAALALAAAQMRDGAAETALYLAAAIATGGFIARLRAF